MDLVSVSPRKLGIKALAWELVRLRSDCRAERLGLRELYNTARKGHRHQEAWSVAVGLTWTNHSIRISTYHEAKPNIRQRRPIKLWAL